MANRKKTGSNFLRLASLETPKGLRQPLRFLVEHGAMKVMALVAGLLVGGLYIDSHYFHGRYFRAASSMTQQIATQFGLPR